MGVLTLTIYLPSLLSRTVHNNKSRSCNTAKQSQVYPSNRFVVSICRSHRHHCRRNSQIASRKSTSWKPAKPPAAGGWTIYFNPCSTAPSTASFRVPNCLSHSIGNCCSRSSELEDGRLSAFEDGFDDAGGEQGEA